MTENHNKLNHSTAKDRIKNGISNGFNPERTLVIDGDILIYKVAAQVEKPIDWGNDLWTLHGDMEEAKTKLADTITYYELTLLAKHIVIALGAKDSFRKEICSDYKANRKKIRKPVVYSPLRKWVEENYKCYIKPKLEGDDVVGILATADIIKGDKVILSSDKDLKTIPTQHWFLGDDDYTNITEEEANYNHMIQTLTGDQTDGYKGCPTVGEVKARRILAPHMHSYKEMWEAVVDTFKKNGLSEKVALMEARMARILRASDYDFKTKKPILWSPPA